MTHCLVFTSSTLLITTPTPSLVNTSLDWFILPLLLPTPTIWFSLDRISNGIISGVGRKWKRSDSSESYSVELMTWLTTPIFDFHQVISAVTTPLTTPTPIPSLVKTMLKGAIYVDAFFPNVSAFFLIFISMRFDSIQKCYHRTIVRFPINLREFFLRFFK